LNSKTKRSISAYFSTFFCLFPLTSSAATSTSNSNFVVENQRAKYLKAKAAFEKKDNTLANQLTNQLKHYPLHPYLELAQIKRDIRTISRGRVESFITKNTKSPVAKKAQASYLQHLANSKQWRLFLSTYNKLPLKSSYYTCYNLQAKISSGQTKNIDKQIQSLWNVGKSQPKPCDPVFSYWIKRGKLTSDIAYQRSWKAILSKNYKIAQFAQKKVTKTIQKNALNIFWKVKKDVSLIAKPKTLNRHTPHSADIAAYAIRKLASKNRDLALKTWLRDRSRFKFSAEQTEYLNIYFGNKYAKQTYYDPNALATLEKIDPKYQFDEVSEWKVRLALITQNWPLVNKLINKMPTKLRQQNRWAYWQQTALTKINPKKYPANYSNVIHKRDFYGFMAAQLKGKPFKLNHKKSAISQNDKKELLTRPAVQRIAELTKTQQTGLAYQEWKVLRTSLDNNQKLTMGYLVNSWGWYIQGIRIAAELKAWDELDIRFPRAQNQLFAKWGKSRNIGSTWPVAIARQESAYNQYAKSSAGARGFMQLMPATAKLTAKKYNVAYKNKSDLFIPQTNIALGTAYLSQMMDKFNNRAHSSAAYNAGPHRAERWLKSRGHLPLDIWIETIPFNETRKYVQNVLTYAVIYDLLDNKKASLFNKAEKAQLALARR
jgi:soluble lytic murein transglycosylase